MNGLWTTLTNTDLAGLEPMTALLVIGLAFGIGHIIAWTYMVTHAGLSYSQAFAASLLVLPVLVALTMLLMFNNVGLAIGLFAVISVVRFRNVLKDTRDTMFVLWAIMEGMACGTTKFGVAILAAICVAAIFLYARFTGFGGRHRFDVILSLQYSGGPENLDALKKVLDRHAVRARLSSQRDLDADNVDLSYRLLMRDPTRSRELVRELEGAPGIGRVSLYHREDEAEI
jgi:hypothetical protein